MAAVSLANSFAIPASRSARSPRSSRSARSRAQQLASLHPGRASARGGIWIAWCSAIGRPERLALLRVANRLAQTPRSRPGRARGHAQPPDLQPGHELLEALADAVGRRRGRSTRGPEPVEHELGRLDALISELVQRRWESSGRGGTRGSRPPSRARTRSCRGAAGCACGSVTTSSMIPLAFSPCVAQVF